MNRSGATFILTLILWILIPMPSALAHTELVSTIPSRNAHLTAIPSQVRVEFGEKLLILGDAQTNLLIVRDQSGVRIDKSDSKVSGRFLTVSLNSKSASGTFTVSWRVVSGDGHPVEGSYQFFTPTPFLISPTVTPDPNPSSRANVTNHIRSSIWKEFESRFLLGALFFIAFFIWARFKYLEKSQPRDVTGS